MGFVIRISTKYTMIAKLTGLFCLLALASASNQIHRVEVFTSDCFQCGMSVLGKISLEVYGQGGRYCKTGMLDNVGSDDYNRGTISTFAGSTIGNCNNYDMGNTRNDVSRSPTLALMVANSTGSRCTLTAVTTNASLARPLMMANLRPDTAASGLTNSKFKSIKINEKAEKIVVFT